MYWKDQSWTTPWSPIFSFMVVGYRDNANGENAYVSHIGFNPNKETSNKESDQQMKKLIIINSVDETDKKDLNISICFSFTILGISLNLVPFFFTPEPSIPETPAGIKQASYPRPNLPQAIPDPSAGIPICSEMNNPHIPLFPSHTVNTCNICGGTPRRLSSCSPPQLCSSREVVSPDVIPIVFPRMC